ncbi:MAG: hypothetical protein Q8N04_08950 [Nitrospira sp.]|nr:hypothetical protein [Nitrospira sp.]MDP3090791.1 hypothetical protein [Nitrospira sp.]
MAQVIRSGAFLQQCWSVHPLCLTVKRIADDRTVVLLCSSCRSAHHLQCNSVVAQASAEQSQSDASVSPVVGESEGLTQLASCIAGHRPALSLREMDVFEDRVLIRCADCRCHYDLAVAQFEMRQK